MLEPLVAEAWQESWDRQQETYLPPARWHLSALRAAGFRGAPYGGPARTPRWSVSADEVAAGRFVRRPVPARPPGPNR